VRPRPYSDPVDYSVLGPLRVESSNGPVEIRGAKERLLLARLVAASGRLVPTGELVEVHNVAFEGFMARRSVVEEVGFPDPSFFIFYDDAEYAVRARRAGHRIWAVRDAVLVRQLDFNQQHDLSGWKGFYMYRNLFVVHLRHGENVLVRLKPWLITLIVVLLSPVRGGRAEARNVIRAIRAARGMRTVPPTTVD